MPVYFGNTLVKSFNGEIKPYQRLLAGLSSSPSWVNELVITLTNATNINLKSVFSAYPGAWDDQYLKKRVIIPTGVEIGGTTSSYALLATTPADGQAGSWAGELILENRGTISGIGGVANSGVGGNAISVNFPGRNNEKLIVNNYGTIRAGGGGGGTGGQGGQGLWYSGRTVTEGPAYDGSNYVWKSGTANFDPYTPGVWWAGVQVYAGNAQNGFYNGGWNYYVGSTMAEGSLSNETYYFAWYQVYRQTTVYDVPNYTSGGAGGAGGRGYGYDNTNVSGSAGSAGGTNAGSGGYGGNGGSWGATGNTGANGNSGNYGGGTAGAAGGLAGFYLAGSAYITLNNYGTVQGRLS